MIIKIVIITFVIIIFYIIINYQVEKFTNKNENEHNYINTNIISPEYNKIYSTLPYDIVAKNDIMNIYDYGNDELNEKFNIIFDINVAKQINLIEGINWSKWINVVEVDYYSNLHNYYNNIIKLIDEKLKHKDLKLPNDKNNFKIIKHNLNKYKKSLDNDNINLLDIDVLIYRFKKPLARHIKIIAVCNGGFTSFLLVKIIGVVNENSLYNNKIKSIDTINNFSEFIPEKTIVYDVKNFIYDTEDKVLHSEISYNLYNKLLKDLTY